MSRYRTNSKTGLGGSRRKATSRSGAPFFTGRKLTVALCVLLVTVTLALYAKVMSYSFLVLDDSDYVTANAHIHHGLSWSTVKWAFTTQAAANWHPVTWLSHALDYQLFGLNAAGHHLDSVLIHALNAVLLFLLLSWMTGGQGPSFLVAALFAWHPINVESVAWIAERKNVLSMLFFLLTMLAYVWDGHRPSWRRYGLVTALFAVALMAKPMVITLPFVLLLMDWWPLGRVSGSKPCSFPMAQSSWARLVLEKAPLFLLSAISAGVTLHVQRSGFAVRSLQQFPLAVRMQNAVVAYVSYLWKAFWPSRLALYPHSAVALPAWQWISAALILLSITAFVIAFRGKPYLPVGWFWFLGTLVPVIGLVQVGEAAMADRYAYLPLIGIFLMIAVGLADLAQARDLRPAWRLVPAIGVSAVLAIVTSLQVKYWSSDYELWSHAWAVHENPYAHDAIGSALLDPSVAITSDDQDDLNTGAKRMDAARRHFERALQIRREMARQNPAAYLPDIATTLNNLGNLDRLERKPVAAGQHYEEAMDIHTQLQREHLDLFPPDLAVTLNNLASLEKDNRQFELAAQHFGEALKIYREMAQRNPDTYLSKVAETLNNLALVEREQDELDEARLHYEEALTIRRQLARGDDAYLPYLAITLNDLGILDAAQNSDDQALRHYEEASHLYRQLARQNPDIYLPYLAATLNNLALADQNQNRVEDSRSNFTEDLVLFRNLYREDPERYAGDVARVQASLTQLEKNAGSR